MRIVSIILGIIITILGLLITVFCVYMAIVNSGQMLGWLAVALFTLAIPALGIVLATFGLKEFIEAIKIILLGV